jgi:hypothetical protein
LVISNELQSALTQNGGTITAAQANSVGISNERLRLLVKADELERVSFGIYVSPDEFVDKMYVTRWSSRPQGDIALVVAVALENRDFCIETAIFSSMLQQSRGRPLD